MKDVLRDEESLISSGLRCFLNCFFCRFVSDISPVWKSMQCLSRLILSIPRYSGRNYIHALHMSYMIKLKRRFMLPLILSIVAMANIIFMRYTITTIQALFPSLGSIEILDFTLSMVSVVLTLPALYTLYKLSREAPEKYRP